MNEPGATFESREYTADSLLSAMLEFEKTYSMTSSTFNAFYQAGASLDIPRREQFQWAAYIREHTLLVAPGTSERASLAAFASA